MTKLSYLAMLFLGTQTLHAAEETTHHNQYGDAVSVNSQRINYEKSHFDLKPKAVQQRAVLSKASPSTNSVNSENLELTEYFSLYSLAGSTGIAGIYSADLYGDGSKQIIAAQLNSINIIEYRDGIYSIAKRIDLPDHLTSTALIKDNASDSYYLFTQENDKLYRINLLTFDRELVLEGYWNSGIFTRDINGDGQDEIIADSGSKLTIVDSLDFSILTERSELYDEAVSVGSFTEKDVTEVLFRDGSIYRLTESAIELQKTVFSYPQGNHNVTVDVDGDGLDEIVVGESWYNINMFSPNSDSILWTAGSSLDISKLIVADINDDGENEVIFGDGQWGALHALSLTSGELFWNIDNPNHSVSSILVDDFNNDGKQDIAWGAGYTSSGDDGFYIHTLEDKALQWSKTIQSFASAAIAMADINGNGSLDVLYSMNRSESFSAIDTQTGEHVLAGITKNTAWDSNAVLATAELFNDGKQYIISGGSHYYQGNVQVFSPETGEEIYQVDLGDGDNVRVLKTYDINGDGNLEIIVGNGADHTGSAGSFVRVINGQTGDVISKSPILSNYWSGPSSIVLGTYSETGSEDLVVLSAQQLAMYEFDSNSISTVQIDRQLNQITGVIIDGVKSLVGASSDGTLYTLSTTGKTTEIEKVCDWQLDNLISSRAGFVQFSCNDKFGEYDLDNQSLSYEIARNNINSKLLGTTLNGVEYTLLSGSSIEVFSNQVADPLDTPDSAEYSTHVLSEIEINLGLTDVGYMVFDNRPDFGSIKFEDRKSGKLIYQPTGIVGEEKLQFYTVKGRARSELADLTIQVTNSAPVAEDQNIQLHWNTPMTFNLNGSDADEEALAYEVKNSPKHGVVELLNSNTGEVVYTPSGESLESVSISFTVKDSLIESPISNVIIELTNTTPTASDLSYRTYYTTEVNGRFSGEDADGDELEYELIDAPATGTLDYEAQSGLFVYTPEGDSTQSVSFTYVVKDKFATSSTHNVVISVEGKPVVEQPKSDSGSGGSLYYLLGLMLLIAGSRRKMW